MSIVTAKVASRICSLITGGSEIAVGADPDKYGDSSILIVKHEEGGPRVLLLTVVDVTLEEHLFTEAVAHVKL